MCGVYNRDGKHKSEPTLRILGVYRPHISEETYQEQWQVTESDEETKEHFDKLVLIEAVADGIDGELDLSDLGQSVMFEDFESFHVRTMKLCFRPMVEC
jgi:hypothetical protein